MTHYKISGFALFSMLGLCALLFMPSQTHAQNKNTPDLPPPIQTLVDDGAQVRYLGVKHGLDGWIAIQNGREQYFYVTQDGQGFVMGLLFDRDGKMVTLRQVQDLQQSAEGQTLDLMAEPLAQQIQQAQQQAASQPTPEELAFKTPAEQLFSAVEDSNWIALGSEQAPAIYTFIDPQCPFCHTFINDLRQDYIANGLIQVRMIPVGFREDTRSQAAFLLAVPNPQNRWYRHLDGDEDALPVTPGINDQGVQRNLAIMQNWKLNVTPLTVYRDKAGSVKIIQGRAQSVQQLISDLEASG